MPYMPPPSWEDMALDLEEQQLLKLENRRVQENNTKFKAHNIALTDMVNDLTRKLDTAGQGQGQDCRHPRELTLSELLSRKLHVETPEKIPETADKLRDSGIATWEDLTTAFPGGMGLSNSEYRDVLVDLEMHEAHAIRIAEYSRKVINGDLNERNGYDWERGLAADVLLDKIDAQARAVNRASEKDHYKTVREHNMLKHMYKALTGKEPRPTPK